MAGGKRTFLAWANLTHNWRRLALAVAGIGFAVLLMTMQLGFRNAMLDSTVAVIDHMNGDLFMISSARYMLSVAEAFSRSRLTRVQSDPDVAAAYPLYIELKTARIENPLTKINHPIRVFAFDPQQPVLLIPGVLEHQKALENQGTVLFDSMSKSDYGPVATGTDTKLTDHPVRVAGTFQLGTDFANDGNLITSSATLSRIFRKPARLSRMFRQPGALSAGLGQVDVGIIKLRDGVPVKAAQTRLTEALPSDVLLLTKDEFEAQERDFWERSTPVGVIFGLGTAVGFLVGIIFCYQILYSDITDNLPELATLKAMGYTPAYFVAFVINEALLLALFGFLPGIAISGFLYWYLGRETGLLLDLTLFRGLMILLLTVAMCCLSAVLTIRRVLTADPAELF